MERKAGKAASDRRKGGQAIREEAEDDSTRRWWRNGKQSHDGRTDKGPCDARMGARGNRCLASYKYVRTRTRSHPVAPLEKREPSFCLREEREERPLERAHSGAKHGRQAHASKHTRASTRARAVTSKRWNIVRWNDVKTAQRATEQCQDCATEQEEDCVPFRLRRRRVSGYVCMYVQVCMSTRHCSSDTIR